MNVKSELQTFQFRGIMVW